MAGINGFGNTQNSLKLTLNSKAKPADVELKSKQQEQPEAKPSAVWLGDDSLLADVGRTRPGDILILENGWIYRHCVDKDGKHSWQETEYIFPSDFESDRGDVRKRK